MTRPIICNLDATRLSWTNYPSFFQSSALWFRLFLPPPDRQKGMMIAENLAALSPIAVQQKICAACKHELPKDKFSKKQWQLKQRRRCKECIADNQADRKTAFPSFAGDLSTPNEVAAITAAAAKLACSFTAQNEARVTKTWTDEDLFKQPPPNEECPICMLLLPLSFSGRAYYPCCGKTI